MLNINAELKENLIITISCMMVVGLFFINYYASPLDTNYDDITKVSWIYSPLISSISMLLFFLFPFLTTKPKVIFLNFFSRKDLMLISGIFLCLSIGFINSENYSYIFQRFQIKLPFLILPIAAASISISKKGFHLILFVFLICCLLVSIYTFCNYLIYYDQINASYLHSKVMPTPINHVRFSILIALACYSSYYILKNNIPLFRFDKVVIISAGLFLFIFIHLYSVRSGLLALYSILIAEVFINIFRRKQYKGPLIALCLAIAFAVITLNLSPTLKNKLLNTKQDLSIYQNNGHANYSSLTTRIISYEIAFELFNENKLLGCGLGDIEIKNTRLFKEQHPEIETPIIPHNEFLYYLAGMGIIGLACFIYCFFTPLFLQKNYLNEFLLMHYIVLFLSFQSEPMIETQLGVACTILFIIFPLMVRKDNPAIKIAN